MALPNQKIPIAALLIGITVICAFLGSLNWAYEVASARLPAAARISVSSGGTWLNGVVILARIAFGQRKADITVPVSPSGNRALQAAWNAMPDTSRFNSAMKPWHERGGVAAFTIGVMLFALWQLSDLSDRALGFLVGIGLAVIVIALWGSTMIAAGAVWRLATRSLRAPTPAPAP